MRSRIVQAAGGRGQEKTIHPLVNAVKGPATKGLFESTGLEPFTTTPQALATFQQAESRKWASIIKAAGIEPE